MHVGNAWRSLSQISEYKWSELFSVAALAFSSECLPEAGEVSLRDWPNALKCFFSSLLLKARPSRLLNRKCWMFALSYSCRDMYKISINIWQKKTIYFAWDTLCWIKFFCNDHVFKLFLKRFTSLLDWFTSLLDWLMPCLWKLPYVQTLIGMWEEKVQQHYLSMRIWFSCRVVENRFRFSWFTSHSAVNEKKLTNQCSYNTRLGWNINFFWLAFIFK